MAVTPAFALSVRWPLCAALGWCTCRDSAATQPLLSVDALPTPYSSHNSAHTCCRSCETQICRAMRNM